MSYQEKRTITSIVSGILILITYCIYAFNKNQIGMVDPDNLKFWASTMLKFIGIGIIAIIIIQIIFHILYAVSIAVKERNYDEKDIEKKIEMSFVEDEMDKLIELKSSRVGYIFIGMGFILGLISIVLDYEIAIMLNIIFLSCLIGTIMGGFLSLYYYKKGIKND